MTAPISSGRDGCERSRRRWDCPPRRGTSSIRRWHGPPGGSSLCGRRARRDPDAGEPVVRPLLRHPLRRHGDSRWARCSPRQVGKARPTRSSTSSVTSPAWESTRPAICSRSTCVSDPPTEDGQTTNDITHNWGPQHQSWNNGAMDSFLSTHTGCRRDVRGTERSTMGYFTRKDLAFYYALADAFTICDGYHCSVLGPTDPNRVMSISATIDPAGVAGGPCLVTQTTERQADYGTFTWTTMPEQLSAAGVSWKVYNDPTALYSSSARSLISRPSSSLRLLQRSRWRRRLSSATYPASFQADVAAGTLPAGVLDHVAARRVRAPGGAARIRGVPRSRDPQDPRLESRRLEPDGAFIIYDENGGFFDHVPPPTPPSGTDGEYLTVDPLPVGCIGDRRADRARLPRPVPRRVPVQPGRLPLLARPSTTPRLCVSWRHDSESRSRISRPGADRSPATSRDRSRSQIHRTRRFRHCRRLHSATRRSRSRP